MESPPVLEKNWTPDDLQTSNESRSNSVGTSSQQTNTSKRSNGSGFYRMPQDMHIHILSFLQDNSSFHERTISNIGSINNYFNNLCRNPIIYKSHVLSLDYENIEIIWNNNINLHRFVMCYGLILTGNHAISSNIFKNLLNKQSETFERILHSVSMLCIEKYGYQMLELIPINWFFNIKYLNRENKGYLKYNSNDKRCLILKSGISKISTFLKGFHFQWHVNENSKSLQQNYKQKNLIYRSMTATSTTTTTTTTSSIKTSTRSRHLLQRSLTDPNPMTSINFNSSNNNNNNNNKNNNNGNNGGNISNSNNDDNNLNSISSSLFRARHKHGSRSTDAQIRNRSRNRNRNRNGNRNTQRNTGDDTGRRLDTMNRRRLRKRDRMSHSRGGVGFRPRPGLGLGIGIGIGMGRNIGMGMNNDMSMSMGMGNTRHTRLNLKQLQSTPHIQTERERERRLDRQTSPQSQLSASESPSASQSQSPRISPNQSRKRTLSHKSASYWTHSSVVNTVVGCSPGRCGIFPLSSIDKRVLHMNDNSDKQ